MEFFPNVLFLPFIISKNVIFTKNKLPIEEWQDVNNNSWKSMENWQKLDIIIILILFHKIAKSMIYFAHLLY